MDSTHFIGQDFQTMVCRIRSCFWQQPDANWSIIKYQRITNQGQHIQFLYSQKAWTKAEYYSTNRTDLRELLIDITLTSPLQKDYTALIKDTTGTVILWSIESIVGGLPYIAFNTYLEAVIPMNCLPHLNNLANRLVVSRRVAELNPTGNNCQPTRNYFDGYATGYGRYVQDVYWSLLS